MPLWIRRSWSDAFMYFLDRKKQEKEEKLEEDRKYYHDVDESCFFKDI